MFLPTGTRIDKLLGLLLVLPALGMAGFAGYTAVRWAMAYRWSAVPCVIQASRVKEAGGVHPYAFEVSYRYAWRGKEYIGGTYQEDYRGSPDIAEAERLVRSFPANARRVCYLNPGRPTEAVLEHDNPLLPLCLAVAMLGCGAVLARAFVFNGRDLIGLGGPFIGIMGLANYVLFFGLALWTGLRSLAWQPIPCVVEVSRVRSEFHHGAVSFRTYWPDIVYRYGVAGITYRANTYNASFVGSPWFYGSRGIVRAFPPGRRTTCYVNPADPSEAVLDRCTSGTQLIGTVPLLMAILGALGTVQTILGREVRLGSPRLWGTLALGLATVLATYVFLVMWADLRRDGRAGIADGTEKGLAIAAGLAAAGLLMGWIALAIAHGRRAGTLRPDPVNLYVWDREFEG